MSSIDPSTNVDIAAVDTVGLDKAAQLVDSATTLSSLGLTWSSDKQVWIDGGSGSSGNDHTQLVADVAALNAARVQIVADRLAFAKTVALAVRTMLESPNYHPATDAQKFYDVVMLTARLLAPTGSHDGEAADLTITPLS
jgi:hypothetical protein